MIAVIGDGDVGGYGVTVTDVTLLTGPALVMGGDREVPYSDVTRERDVELIYNDVSVKGLDDTESVAVDMDSQKEFFQRSLSRDTKLAFPADRQAQADLLLARYRTRTPGSARSR